MPHAIERLVADPPLPTLMTFPTLSSGVSAQSLQQVLLHGLEKCSLDSLVQRTPPAEGSHLDPSCKIDLEGGLFDIAHDASMPISTNLLVALSGAARLAAITSSTLSPNPADVDIPQTSSPIPGFPGMQAIAQRNPYHALRKDREAMIKRGLIVPFPAVTPSLDAATRVCGPKCPFCNLRQSNPNSVSVHVCVPGASPNLMAKQPQPETPAPAPAPGSPGHESDSSEGSTPTHADGCFPLFPAPQVPSEALRAPAHLRSPHSFTFDCNIAPLAPVHMVIFREPRQQDVDKDTCNDLVCISRALGSSCIVIHNGKKHENGDTCGSSLIHHHYQSMQLDMPVEAAPPVPGHSTVVAGCDVTRLHWPFPVCRISSRTAPSESGGAPPDVSAALWGVVSGWQGMHPMHSVNLLCRTEAETTTVYVALRRCGLVGLPDKTTPASLEVGGVLILSPEAYDHHALEEEGERDREGQTGMGQFVVDALAAVDPFKHEGEGLAECPDVLRSVLCHIDMDAHTVTPTTNIAGLDSLSVSPSGQF
ncbi:hypothetical protein KIPB_003412 [Kipferlia bialata]|uniref:Uncharacterized protein n=1 Tax=Kipferlia bialata TaxID=797122 RepID=A0A9K3GHF0_9EUKA|nr:hypothetical protein KIPB_003412 [Kipferlia bialata]|eukprot:g3412.t1